MAEEIKKEEQVAGETPTENTEAKPKVVFAYTVTRYDNGLSSIDGLPLEENGTPSIDQYHIALDIISFGRKLDKQLTLEEAEARVIARLQKMAEEQAPKEETPEI